MFELDEIKQLRKSLNLTQSELSKKSGVSQSLIAKLESGRIDPTYSKAKKIFETLNELSKKDTLKASQIMQKKIFFIDPEDNIKDAINKMKKYEISQMPVIKDNKSIGLISESIILDALMNGKTGHVKDIMGDSPPIISMNTSIDAVSELLKFFPVVLISEHGKLEGVITKIDIIRNMRS